MIDGGFKLKNDMPTALRAYRAATQKDLSDILNRAARNVAFRAASFTPKASAATIRADIMSDRHLRFALTSMALKRKGIGRLKAGEFSKAVAKYVGRRASSGAYLRSAYAKAVEELGGSFKGPKFRGADGFGNKSTRSRLVAQIIAIVSQPTGKKAASAERIGSQALNRAIQFVAEDMLSYAQNKLAQTAAAHSG